MQQELVFILFNLLQIVPATLKKPSRPESRPRPMPSRSQPSQEGSRDSYRRAPSGADKIGDAGAGASTPEFVSIIYSNKKTFYVFYKS